MLERQQVAKGEGCVRGADLDGMANLHDGRSRHTLHHKLDDWGVNAGFDRRLLPRDGDAAEGAPCHLVDRGGRRPYSPYLQLGRSADRYCTSTALTLGGTYLSISRQSKKPKVSANSKGRKPARDFAVRSAPCSNSSAITSSRAA